MDGAQRCQNETGESQRSAQLLQNRSRGTESHSSQDLRLSLCSLPRGLRSKSKSTCYFLERLLHPLLLVRRTGKHLLLVLLALAAYQQLDARVGRVIPRVACSSVS